MTTVAFFQCSECQGDYPIRSDNHVVYGRAICDNCFRMRYFVCNDCGMTVSIYDRRRIDTRYVCATCHNRYSVWDQSMFTTPTTHLKTRSTRKFGIELETSDCTGYRGLRNKTCFGAKYDCSVSGMEFVSPILHGDAGLEEIQKFCDLANEMDFEVGTDCGYHLHIDMNDEDTPALKSIAYAYLKADSVWRELVDRYRACGCGYCEKPAYTRRILEDTTRDWARFCDDQDRYTLCNLNAYPKFGSYEIRLYQGTLDAKEICNWIKAHLAFVEWAKMQTFDDIDDAFKGSSANKWESLKAIMGDINLNRYYGRIRRENLVTA